MLGLGMTTEGIRTGRPTRSESWWERVGDFRGCNSKTAGNALSTNDWDRKKLNVESLSERAAVRNDEHARMNETIDKESSAQMSKRSSYAEITQRELSVIFGVQRAS